jgi:hypothetical protein
LGRGKSLKSKPTDGRKRLLPEFRYTYAKVRRSEYNASWSILKQLLHGKRSVYSISTTNFRSTLGTVPGKFCENSQNQDTRQDRDFAVENTHQSEENVMAGFIARKAVQVLRLRR